jgi:hypothetical protein
MSGLVRLDGPDVSTSHASWLYVVCEEHLIEDESAC